MVRGFKTRFKQFANTVIWEGQERRGKLDHGGSIRASNSKNKKQLTDWLPRFAMKQARMTCLPTRADTFPELRVGSMNGSKVSDDVGTGIVYNIMHI